MRRSMTSPVRRGPVHGRLYVITISVATDNPGENRGDEGTGPAQSSSRIALMLSTSDGVERPARWAAFVAAAFCVGVMRRCRRSGFGRSQILLMAPPPVVRARTRMGCGAHARRQARAADVSTMSRLVGQWWDSL